MKLFEIRNPNSIWTDKPDEFESAGVEYYIDIVEINKITGIDEQATVSGVKDLMKDIKKGDKIPLILLEKLSDDNYYYDDRYDYELHDGQHRFQAFRKLYPKYNKIKAAIFSMKK